MTGLRVTAGSMRFQALQNIQTTAQHLSDLQQKVSSGLAISKPSDDPLGTAGALRLSSQKAQNDQYQAQSTDAIGWLSTADTAYSSLVTQAQKVQQLVIQGMNTGSNSTLSNNALADQVDALRTSMLAIANTQYAGQSVFAGTASGPAFNGAGAYVGDTGAVTRTIGAGNSVTINQTGTQVFGANGSNLFDTLTSISAALRTSPSSLSGQLNTLNAQVDNISEMQSLEGAAYNQVTTAQTVATTADSQIRTKLSSIVEVDMAQAIIDVTSANTAYQAALQTTATISQRSLLDFLR